MFKKKVVPEYKALTLITDGHEPEPGRFRDVWRRAHIRLLTSIRISKMMKNIKLLGPRTLIEINSCDTINDMIQKHQLLLSSTKTINESLLLPRFLFHPSGGFKIYWNVTLGLLLLYTALVTPFLIAFIQSNGVDAWFVIDYILLGAFVLDVFFTLNTAYHDSEGKLIASRKKIFMNYLKGWLIIDLIACFPFDLIEYALNPSGSSKNTYNTLSKLIRLKNLPRLFRLSKLLVFFKKNRASPFLDSLYYFFSLSHSGVRLLSTVSMILLSLHIVACLWYFMARFYEFSLLFQFLFEKTSPYY